jgi:cell division protein FtsZ
LRPTAAAVGVGGAGSDLLSHLMDLEIQGLQCIVVDTDQYNLQISRAHSKILIPTADTLNFNTEIGTNSLPNLSSELHTAIKACEIVFVLVGLGGATGGRMAPIIAEQARKNGSIVIGLVTRPFQHERDRFHVAVSAVRKMLNVCDTVVLIDNHAFELSSITLPLGLESETARQTCGSIVQSLISCFTKSGLCNAEIGELRTMLRRGGLAEAGVGHSHSHLGAEEASLRALRNTIAHSDLTNAAGILLNIAGGSHIQRKHIESAAEIFSGRISSSAQMLYGHGQDTSLIGVTRVTLLATGFTFPSGWRGYRKLPLELYDLEPESGEEEIVSLRLKLDQLESYAT